MGISWGRTALVMVSAQRRRDAPTSIETGTSLRLSGPVTNLTMWGTRRPTKPIIPETETEIAARREPVTSSINVTFLVSTPRLVADLSPRETRFKSLAKNMAVTKPPPRKSSVSTTSNQVLEAKLPMSQKIITATCSSAVYLRKLIPAERMAPTIMPERIRVLEEREAEEFFPVYERYITKSRVRQAPAKANSGTETIAAPRLKRIAIQAPKAAPAETPSV